MTHRLTLFALLVGFPFWIESGSRPKEAESLRTRVAQLETRLAAAEKAISVRASDTTDVVRARQFILVDKQGRERALLFTEKNMASLVIMNEEGRSDVMLSAGEIGPVLELHNPQGGSAYLTAGTNGPLIELLGTNGVRTYASAGSAGPLVELTGFQGHSVDLSVGTNGGALRLRDPEKVRGTMVVERGLSVFSRGHTRASLNLLKGEPALSLFDDDGTRRLLLGKTDTGVLTMTMRDANEKARCQLSLTERGPSLTLLDAREQARAALGITEGETTSGEYKYYPESSLLLLRADGRVLWTAP